VINIEFYIKYHSGCALYNIDIDVFDSVTTYVLTESYQAQSS